MAGDVHGAREPLRRAVDEAALQVALRRPGDRMHDDVEPAPLPRDALEERLELAGLRYVQWRNDRRLELPGERLDIGLGLLVEVGDGEIGAQLPKRRRAAVGDGMLIGDARDERLLAAENGAGDGERHERTL